jgi:hypothetical protein
MDVNMYDSIDKPCLISIRNSVLVDIDDMYIFKQETSSVTFKDDMMITLNTY